MIYRSRFGVQLLFPLASCPGSLRGRKVEPGTHCLRMLSSPRISGGLETSGYYSVILSVYHRITVRCTRVVGELYAPGSILSFVDA